MFPGVAFRGDGVYRRPWVIGTAFDVWQVVDAYRDVGSVEKMAAEGILSKHQIRLALAYYEWFPDGVDADVANNHRSLDELRAEFPSIAVH